MEAVDVNNPHAPIRTPRARWEVMLAEVAEKHGVTSGDILGRERIRKIVAARHEICRRLHAELGIGYKEIGRRLGRDHTSVMYACGCRVGSAKQRRLVRGAPLELQVDAPYQVEDRL